MDKKILIMTDSITEPTGYGTHAKILVEELKKRGWNIYLLVGNVPPLKNEMVEKYENEGITIINNTDWDNTYSNAYPSKKLVEKVIDSINPDIFLTIADFHVVYPYIRLRSDNRRKWIHWYLLDNDAHPEDYTESVKKIRKVVFSSFFGFNIKKDFIKDECDTNVIYLSADIETFFLLDDREYEKQTRQLNDKFVISTVARHQPRKTLSVTTEAAARFLMEHEDAVWMLRTDINDISMDNEDENDKDILKILRRYGVGGEQVAIYGKIPGSDLNLLYNLSDVFIHLSGGEGFGLPYVESMLAGTPCILNDNTTSPELTGNWKFGLPVKIKGKKHSTLFNTYFDEADLESAYQQLEFAYNDWKTGSNWLKQAGKEAREFHLIHSNIKNNVDKLEEVFYDILNCNSLETSRVEEYDIKASDIKKPSGVFIKEE